MPAKKGGRPGPKPRPDSKQRERLVSFRMQDLYSEFDRRAPAAGASVTAKRDLQRYWSLMDYQLRHVEIDPADLKAFGDYWLEHDHLKSLPIASGIASLMGGVAETVGARSLSGLTNADAMAIADLMTRVRSGGEAEQLLLDILQNG